ncbi:MAG: 1-acyl-sn-glycerol-3-phosphate acyltransferase [Treponema sp.]|nr:1-acyl-sn-glycerol-3-phosphate acyltransferase [Treponema sp.]
MIKTLHIFFKIVGETLVTNKKTKQAKKILSSGNSQEANQFIGNEVMSWAKKSFEATGSTIEITGEENVPKDGSCVFICNHQSMLDILVLLGYVDKPKGFVAKIEIMKVPIVAKWMKYMQCIFLHRKNPRQSVEAMKNAIENVKKGQSMVIFPEGTRTKDGNVHEFKSGSFKLAFQANAPIVPVTINGTRAIFEEKKRIRPSHVKLTIHKAVPTKDLTKEEKQNLPEQIRQIIVAAL